MKSCKSEAQKQKEQQINLSISEMKTEIDSFQNTQTEDSISNAFVKEKVLKPKK